MKMKNLSKLILTLVFLISCLCNVIAQGYQPTTYFTTEEMPDLIQCLPAPPDSTSEAFSYDVLRYMWGKMQRYDTERAEMAKRDAVWSYEALLAELSVPFGLEISEKGTPEIWKLITNSLATVDQMRVAPKAAIRRDTPCAVGQRHCFSLKSIRMQPLPSSAVPGCIAKTASSPEHIGRATSTPHVPAQA